MGTLGTIVIAVIVLIIIAAGFVDYIISLYNSLIQVLATLYSIFGRVRLNN